VLHIYIIPFLNPEMIFCSPYTKIAHIENMGVTSDSYSVNADVPVELESLFALEKFTFQQFVHLLF